MPLLFLSLGNGLIPGRKYEDFSRDSSVLRNLVIFRGPNGARVNILK
ncbi:hypothetical protein Closa_2168 [[Clostridium] saccharolyticum WM1]|uniref:Uncharacterized protein n=1 Tax=Lacrimispora saccharolytica (strain ATCC 35040 / DSM 2544 / NRCC 2533 / WM1) TaxID=610130 RepID=D9R297_LACSW|nr:hypothetical protein Closa_2168 [[Clostridium] saccharolyticum WM1]